MHDDCRGGTFVAARAPREFALLQVSAPCSWLSGHCGVVGEEPVACRPAASHHSPRIVIQAAHGARVLKIRSHEVASVHAAAALSSAHPTWKVGEVLSHAQPDAMRHALTTAAMLTPVWRSQVDD